MTGTTGPAPPSRAWTWLAVAAIAAGAWIRLDQFGAQVLIDDEWHAVHQLLRLSPAQMFLDFGHADYSIPLGLYDALVARYSGLSESAMRLPMLACGLATLVLFPLYVAPRLGRPTAAVFALLLAISPLLVIYSRMARPYAITLFAGYAAHAAFCRYEAAARGERAAGAAYALLATLAAWLHPIVVPFVLAPFAWALVRLPGAAPGERRPRTLRLLALAATTGTPMAALLIPPLLAHPGSLGAKAGVDFADLDTLVGAWHMWLGTPSTSAGVVCTALAAIGLRDVWRALPIARTASIGLVLTLAALAAARPAWSHVPITFARYLLPMLPLLLVAAAAGAARLAAPVAAPGRTIRNAAATAVAFAPVVGLAAASPLPELLRHPNAQTVHLVYHVDFRAERNPYLPYMAKIPLSPFWSRLAASPPGSVTVAAAPFYFESYDWDAPRWEAIGRQRVIPGYLTGLCVERRDGEIPDAPAFRFENAVHLANAAELAAHGVDWIVWQKPFVQTGRGRPEDVGRDTAHCEAALRERFGPPAYEDAQLVAFRRPRPGGRPGA
jgi:hypothetical protein